MRLHNAPITELATSKLFDETTFYQRFTQDLAKCQKEVFIESPFITAGRMNMLKPTLEKLLKKGVKVCILTRRPEDHDEFLSIQAEEAITWCEEIGIEILLCDNNSHRKLAILDRQVLWEGSLNILSQTHSREIMRRIEGQKLALQMFDFLKLQRFI